MGDNSLLDQNEDNFGSWLQDIATSYKSFNNEQRNILLEQLIINSEPNQLEFLDSFLPPLTCKDFITNLSLEHVTIILKYLNGKDILKCCQVCKSWRDRINSLTHLWETKAYEVGVDLCSVFKKYSHHNEMSKVYKTCYCLALQFLSGLKRYPVYLERLDAIYSSDDHLRIHLTDDSIVIKDGVIQILEIFSFPDWNLKHTVSVCYSLLPCYKHPLVFTHDYEGNAYCWNVETNSATDIYDAYSSDSDTQNNVYEKRSLHKIGGGDFYKISTLDVIVILNETFVITGAESGLMKLWKMHPTRKKSELLITLDKLYRLYEVFRVHFLPNDGDGKLRFISESRSQIVVWCVDVKTLHQVYSGTGNTDCDRFDSCFFEFSKPEIIFITQSDSETKISELKSFHICKKSVKLELMEQWNLSKRGWEAHIVGVGSRFALLVSLVNLQMFQLFDLVARCTMTTFATSHCFQSLPIKLYNSAWLDGFVFEEDGEMPTIVGSAIANEVNTLTLELPVLEDRLYDTDIDSSETDNYTDGTNDSSEEKENSCEVENRQK